MSAGASKPHADGRASSMTGTAVHAASILLLFVRFVVLFSLFRVVEFRCSFGCGVLVSD
jgi:hypothetical protein